MALVELKFIERYHWRLSDKEIYENFKKDDRYNPNAKYSIILYPSQNVKVLKQILDNYSLEGISAAVCTAFNITFKDLSSSTKYKHSKLYPKHFYYYYAKKLLPKLSYNTISNYLGGYHHASVIYGIKRINFLLDDDVLVKEFIKKINYELKL